jgi:hypothetical protein
MKLVEAWVPVPMSVIEGDGEHPHMAATKTTRQKKEFFLRVPEEVFIHKITPLEADSFIHRGTRSLQIMLPHLPAGEPSA